MSDRQDLLLELGTEELPPKALLRLITAFRDNIAANLQQIALDYQQIEYYATPRRLALIVRELQTRQADKTVDRRGPALQAAYDAEGQPTQAAMGFAKSCGVDVADLDKLETDKGSWLFYQLKQQGKPASELLPDVITQALAKLPIPKRMRWADLDAQFVRPVHWLVVLLGNDVIDCEVLSVKSGRQTYGHRFHYDKAIDIAHADEYVAQLAEPGKVIANFDERKQQIREQIQTIAQQTQATSVVDEDLLDEVTAMVEWPVAILGHFEQRFLDVPQEALISTMAENQKYFHLVDAQQQLLPHFITISNIESKDVQKVIEGNERVIRPRFADAEFFWQQDKKQPLAQHIESLKTVVFQKQLGSLYDKSQRIASLAAQIGQHIAANDSYIKTAAELCKCDLMTNMVYEFPELQGIMGRYYAKHDQHPDEVATALDEVYMPRFAGDDLPQTKTGQAIAIADRLDTLLGIIAIGQMPTGDKDPYGLRRAALGVLRIMIENNLSLDLMSLLTQHADTFTNDIDAKTAVTETVDFILERLKTYYLNQGIRVDAYEAVRIQRPTQPNDFDARIHAVTAFQNEAAAESLAAANKRISNILKKTDATIPTRIDDQLLSEQAEKQLAQQLADVSQTVKPLIAQRDYTETLRQLSALRDNVDLFFDNVMVMVDDESIRANRLALLHQLRTLFLDVADISQLQPLNS